MTHRAQPIQQSLGAMFGAWLGDVLGGPRRRVASGLALGLAALCAFASASASAQTSPTQYVVSGVRVDVSSQNATQARDQAFEQAPADAWQRLKARITDGAAADGSAAGATPQLLDQLVASITVEEERRSGTRYVGLFTVTFRGEPVRRAFQAMGLTVIDQRGQPMLIVPTIANATPSQLTAWRNAWEQGGFAQELRPLSIAPGTIIGAPDWTLAASAAANAGAPTAIFVQAMWGSDSVSATLTEVGPNGFRRDRGRVTAPVRGGGAGLEEAFRRLAAQANGQVQTEYRALLSSGGAPTAPTAERVSLSVLYNTLSDWTAIKRGLEAAEDSMVRDVRIEAINRRGALVSFTSTGTVDQLAAELVRHGVGLEPSNFGLVLRTRGR